MKVLFFVFALVAVSISLVSAKSELHKFGSNPSQECCGLNVIDTTTTKACCGTDSVYDTTKDTCCPFGGDIGSRVVSGLGSCCAFVDSNKKTKYATYDNTVSTCCARGVFDGIGGICCGTKYISATDVAANKDCCGVTVFNTDEDTCCSDDLVKGTGKACCLNKANTWVGYDASKKTCCEDGELVSGGGSLDLCCNGKAYDSSLSSCCAKNIIDDSDTGCCNGKTYDLTLYSCCGSSIINTATEFCCIVPDPLAPTSQPITYTYPITLGTQSCCWDKPIPVSYTCCALNRGDHTLGQGATATEQCCAHSVVTASPDLSCCEDSSDLVSHAFEPVSQTCCSDGEILKGGPTKTACCNGKAYNPAKKTCCSGKLFQTSDFTSPDCCGSKVYDNADKLCCGKNLFDRSDFADPACCGSNAYDSSSRDCCGTTIFRPTRETCCKSGGKTALISGEDTPCCGLKKAKGDGDACCGVNHYDSATEVCCNGKIGTGDRCCGSSEPYDSSTHFCCSS